MSLNEYLERLHKGINTIEKYGFTESVQIKEEIRPHKQGGFPGTLGD